MNVASIILLSFTICIDSFILCLLTKIQKKAYFIFIPAIFTFFQCLFIYIGYNFGSLLEKNLENYTKYIAFLTFSFMAIKLIIDAFFNKNAEKESFNTLKSIILQAIITSFDSLFLGTPIAISNIDFLFVIVTISCLTFLLCLVALLIRSKIKNQLNEKINLIGSIILFYFAFKSLI